MSDDDYAHLDAAYVLGALPPQERRDYERHLEGCDACSRAVREIAGLPGLLSRLDAEEVAGLDDREPMPASLLPALLTEVRRRGRRRRLVLVATSGVAAAALVVAGLVLGVAGRPAATVAGPPASSPSASAPSATSSSTARPAVARPMTPLGQYLLAADLRVRGVAWGTRLSVTCRYLTSPPKDLGPLDYALVVRTRGGGEEQVGSWRGVPGKEITFAAATRSRPQDITGVEVRTMSGHPLLRARL